jgi:hypothetical protein
MKRATLMFTAFLIFFFGFLPFHLASGESYLPIEIKSYQGISYISGGIGFDERKALKEMGKDYGLKLVFAASGGAYLADVNVQIKDASGAKIFEAVSEGPWFYANLRPGEYTVYVTVTGDTLNKTAQVKEGSQTELRFYW